MIANTERMYGMIKEYNERYDSIQDYIKSHFWLDKLIEHTADLRSSEKLLKMPKHRIISLISNFYCLGPGAYRLSSILEENSSEEIKDSIFILLYGEGEIEDRLIMARRSGIGTSFLTQTLCFFDPKQYSIKDRISKIGICMLLGYGNIIPGDLFDDEKGASPYDDMTYIEFHKLVTEVGKHFILRMLQSASDEKDQLARFINSRKYIIIDQFLRFCYCKSK